MKKLLLTLAAVVVAATTFAQSLVFVETDHAGTYEKEATGDRLPDFNFPLNEYGMYTYFFYVKNTSAQAGKVTPVALEYMNDYAQTHLNASFCYNGSCYETIEQCPPFEIGAYGEFRGGTNFDGSPITEGSGLDMQIMYKGANEAGTAEVRFAFQFDQDQAPSVCYLNLQFTDGSGIASAEVINNLKVYQDEAGNVVADYGFGNDAARELSIVSLAGQTLYTCPVDGVSGNMVLPVNLGKGVYLYSVTEGGKVLSSHKLVVR